MNDVLLVAEIKCPCERPYVVGGQLLCKLSCALELLVELASWRVLQYEEYPRLVVEVAV